jgi:prolipoprotein diacylglyceryl transferase
VIASIPSPSSGSIHIGPISLNAYGLMIALGVVAGVWLFGRRLEARHVGTRDDASAIALWAVLAGVIGARLYHVLTDWERFEDDLGEIPKIWEGGLGIPGGILAGALVGVWVARRRGLGTSDVMACAAPAIPLAQAIGRWGNWFNQELFGRPTDLPWALEIDDEHLPAGYPSGTTFHPTFLYESLWNLGLCGFLLWIDKRYRMTGGQLMAVYVAGYGVGRFWIEGLRIDPAHEIGPFRWNQWVAIACVVGGVGFLIYRALNPVPAVTAAPAQEGDRDGDVGEVTEDLVDAGDVEDAPAEPDDRDVRDGRPSPSRTGADDPAGGPGSADPPSGSR